MDTLLSMDKRVITKLLKLCKNEVNCWNCRKGTYGRTPLIIVKEGSIYLILGK